MDDISGEIEIELYFLNSRTPVIPGSLAVIWDVKPNTSLLLAVYGVILISLLFLECFPIHFCFLLLLEILHNSILFVNCGVPPITQFPWL